MDVEYKKGFILRNYWDLRNSVFKIINDYRIFSYMWDNCRDSVDWNLGVIKTIDKELNKAD